MKDTADFGWPTTPLGDLVDVLDRLRKPITKKDRKAGPYPYYGATGVLDHVDGYLFDEPLVLIGEDGAKWEAGANSAFAIEGKTWVNNHAHVIRPHRDQVLDDWLIYYLNGADLMPFISGMTVPKLNQGRLREIPIPLPPLEEQQRIVAVLDEAFEGLARARAHAEANLQNARELLSAELEKVFDIELADEDRATFEDITKDTLIGLVRSKKEQGPEREYDYAKMNNIGNDDRFVGPVLDRVDCTPEEASRFELRGGDFLFNTRNSRELVGKSCVVESDFQRPTVFNNNVMRVRFDSGVSSRFVALAFKSKQAKAQLEAMKSGTTNVVAIYHKSLKKLKMPMPSLETQKTLVDRFEELDTAIQRLISNYSEQAEDTDDLRQSLLQKAFAGELT